MSRQKKNPNPALGLLFLNGETMSSVTGIRRSLQYIFLDLFFLRSCQTLMFQQIKTE